MYYLVYLSTATALYTDEQLAEILETSRKNNSALGITGLLLYHDGAILQVLEGGQQEVENLFDRIGKDYRHHGILKIVDGQAHRRYFEDWSMGFHRLSDREWSQVAGYLPAPKSSPSILTEPSADHHGMVTIIRSFATANFR